MFSRNLCFYKSLILNNCSTTTVTICCFIHSDCNNPLIMTHLCYNDSISKIESVPLVDSRDLVHCIPGKFPRRFENKDAPLHMEGVSDLSY